jgi:hypothetical protein
MLNEQRNSNLANENTVELERGRAVVFYPYRYREEKQTSKLWNDG